MPDWDDTGAMGVDEDADGIKWKRKKKINIVVVYQFAQHSSQKHM